MKKVLVCPLDWGLGHATRCIPIIWELQKRGMEVIIASSGASLALLKLEFPPCIFFELPAYQPEYPRGHSMVFKIIVQMPKFLGAIRAEHQMVEQIVRDQGIDVIISDNRYGCWSGKIRSIFLTHQVKIPMPVGFGWSSSWVNYYSRRAIQQFAEVWIPDQPGSGLTDYFMSDDVHNIRYIGWLSRFEARRGVARKYEIVALVSGPEPQRSIFEGKISSQLLELGLKALLVAGEPQRPYRTMEGCLERVNHLGGQELEDAILSSDIVISRSGYSTIMDLMALGKKAIFIPTTGQPEQLYLAKYLDEQRIAVAMNMNDFSIKLALEKSVGYRGLTGFDRKGNLLSKAIDTLLP